MKALRILVFALSQIFPGCAWAQCWNLVYEDNFDGTALQSKYWTARDQPGFSQSNGELQYHLTQNVAVGGGSLHLVAKKENFGSYPYTSGWVDSKLKINFRYGRIVSRMKLPAGKGLWPAFWLVPLQEVYGEWPHSGEIDIMENIGSDTKTVYGTFHTVDKAGTHVSNSVPYTIPPVQDFSTAFHDFELQWTPTEMRWYVDGVLYSTQPRNTYSSWKWPFDQQFYIIFSLAVGGSWPGSPGPETAFPAELVVDYVKVYQSDDLIEISGSSQVERNSVTHYSLPDYPLAEYFWEVPSDATIISGQGTRSISVRWGSLQGVNTQLKCKFKTPCSQTRIETSKAISIVSNVLDNSGFELGYAKWFRNNASGAATFSLERTNPGEELQSAKVEIAAPSAEYWRSQLSRNVYNLSGADTYEVRFLAKANVPGKVMGISVLNPTSYSTIGTSTFNLSDQWQSYQLQVKLTSQDTAALLTLDLGHAAGTFWFDGISFGKISDPLPVRLVSFSGQSVAEGTKLTWTTDSETDNDFFDIERSDDARYFTKIGRVAGNGTSNVLHQYHFIDPNQANGLKYYRLKQVDFGGKSTFSRIVSVDGRSKLDIVVAPNPGSDYVQIFNDQADPVVQMEVADVSGKVLLIELASRRANLRTLRPGIYILTAKTTSGRVVSRKIMKQ